MPAYLKDIGIKCMQCPKPATCTLFNTHNEKIADYCKVHGEAALADWLSPPGEHTAMRGRLTWAERLFGGSPPGPR